jgi:hypothetical protein
MSSQEAFRPAQRSMFIGLGGTGNEVIRRVKREMLRHDYDLPIFQYLVLDTMPFSESPKMDPLLRLRNGEEYLYIGGYNPRQMIERLDEWPSIAQWWGTRDFDDSFTVDEGAGQMRKVGRLAFFRHFKEIRARFEQMCRAVLSRDNREQALRAGYEVSLNRDPVIYLMFSLVGGTGSSLFFDVAYVLRQLFAPAVKPTVVGVVLLPGPYIQEISSLPQQERIQANAYAALQELEQLQQRTLGLKLQVGGEHVWQVEYATNFQVSSSELPLDYLYLVDDTNEYGEKYTSDQLYELVGQAIYWHADSSIGTRYWERAKNLISNTAAMGNPPEMGRYSTFGISTVALNWRGEQQWDEYELQIRLLDNLSSSLPPVSELLRWRDQLQKAQQECLRAEDEGVFEPVIQVPLHTSQQRRARQHDLEGLRLKVLEQTFGVGLDSKDAFVEKLQKAISQAAAEAVRQFYYERRLLKRLLEEDEIVQRKRRQFFQRASCLWNFQREAYPEIETIALLGIGENRDDLADSRLQSQLRELLKDQEPRIELVATNFSDEMAFLKTAHGLRLEMLKSLPELQKAYQDVISRGAHYLHLW